MVVSFWVRAFSAALLAAACIACERHAPVPSERSLASSPASVAGLAAAPDAALLSGTLHGDASRGKELVQHYECNRCHEGTGQGTAALTKNCFSCHEQIMQGRFPVSAAALLRFRPHVESAREAPSLTAIGARLQAAWIRGYLLAPRDLRPRLTPTMPRLELDAEQASDIVAYLTAGARPESASALPDGNPERGRELMDQKGCAGCHAFGGVPDFTALEPAPSGSDAARAAALAPDLRFTRERFRKEQLLAWLLDPQAIKADTRMPSFGFSPEEARDIASYILGAALAPEVRPSFTALPLLTRRVAFDEVNRQVFSRTCHHCHTDAEAAGGDGGPGNTGGFGFAPRGVSFSSHASILAGYVDAHGQRRSLFEPLADGTPRLVAALLARHDELKQAPRSDVRGMPLALPPLSSEDIQLVASWVAQGKPL